MIIPYTQLPGGASARPLADITASGVAVKGLVDSGSINTIFHAWVADLAGVDISDAPLRRISVGADQISLQLQTIELMAAGQTWEAEVGFSRDWTQNWALLGQDAFFRYFQVLFRAADLEFELVGEQS